MAAAESGSVEVLRYLQQQGLLTSAARLTAALDDAAAKHKIDAVKWLREQGAKWPTAFRRWHPWSSAILAWAREKRWHDTCH
jgi:hypothetical protein